MQLNSYLLFDGHCEAAFRFYERCLGGKIDCLVPHEGTPCASQVPAEWRSKILHAHMTIGDQVLMGSDAPPDRYQQPKGFSVSVQVTSTTEAERVFHALAENGKIQMPIQETFWAERFGMLTDQFGTPWMVNCQKAA